VLRRLREDVGQARLLLLVRRGAFTLGRRGLVLRYAQADLLGEFGHRIDETHAAVLDQEADRVAVRPAAEAVVELLGRADGEAG